MRSGNDQGTGDQDRFSKLRVASFFRRLRGSGVATSVIPVLVAFTAVFAVRMLYGILYFPYLGTEDNYQLLVYGTSVHQTGQLLNEYASLEPRIQNVPPLIPLFLAGFLLFAPGQAVTGMLILAFMGQVVTLYFIFRILHSLGLSFSWAVLGSLLPLLSYRFVWVTSLSTPDSLLVALGALSGWLFVKSLRNGFQPIYLVANFATLVVLTWTHNFGVLLGGIMATGYVLALALDYKRTFFLYLVAGTGAWAALILPRLVFVTGLYQTGTTTGLSDPTLLAGMPFVVSIPSYYGEVLILLLLPLGILSILSARNRTRGIVLFPLWLGLNVLILAVIPDSFSHRSRYPLQFLVPLAVVMGVGLSWIYALTLRLHFPPGLRRIRKHIAIGLVAAFLTPAVFALAAEAPPSLSRGKDFLAGSYGLRETIGRTLSADYPDASVLYRYWPSLITGYGGLPSINLIDFVVLAKNNENIVEVALERKVSHFFFDRLSGSVYPFDEKARDLLDLQSVGLEQVQMWNARAVLYQIIQPENFIKETVLASQPAFSGENMSSLQTLRVDGRAITVRPAEYAYRTLESPRGSLNIQLTDDWGNGTRLFFLAANMPSGARLDLAVSCGGREVANKTILQPVSTTQVWWFDYHPLEFILEASGCASLHVDLETDSPGQVDIHKVQIFKLWPHD